MTALNAGNLNINGVNIGLNATNANSLSATIQTVNGFTAKPASPPSTTLDRFQLVSNEFGSAGNFTATFSTPGTAAAVG